VRGIAEGTGVDGAEAVCKTGYRRSSRLLAARSALGGDLAFLSWKLCSGFTHGDSWATWGAADRVELPGAPPGLGAFKIEANVKMLAYVTTFATQMTRLGWLLYDQRGRAPY
jgi:hypothetical protein